MNVLRRYFHLSVSPGGGGLEFRGGGGLLQPSAGRTAAVGRGLRAVDRFVEKVVTIPVEKVVERYVDVPRPRRVEYAPEGRRGGDRENGGWESRRVLFACFYLFF